MDYTIRPIEARDNRAVEDLIRTCLIEFGADHAGTAWTDPDLGRFSEIYSSDGNRYWVALNENGRIAAGVGIGELPVYLKRRQRGAGNVRERKRLHGRSIEERPAHIAPGASSVTGRSTRWWGVEPEAARRR